MGYLRKRLVIFLNLWFMGRGVDGFIAEPWWRRKQRQFEHPLSDFSGCFLPTEH